MSANFVIMAAGLGSRYGGIKQMEGVGPNGEILLEYAVFDALRAGFDKITVILRPDIVEDFRDRVGRRLEKKVPLSYAIQDYSSLPTWYALPQERTKPFGTIHAVLCAAECIDGPFAVLNADDYYGRNAFTELCGKLEQLRGAGDGCMVAYKLKNTVSPFGTVTRGVCAARDGLLTSIHETHDIALLENGVIRCPQGELDGESAVSMNLWGFTKEALEDMDVYFQDFLKKLDPAELKGECLLPVYVEDRLHEGKLGIRVMTTSESWFGMTYKDDRRSTAESLRRLHEQGAYPGVLFE